MRIEAQLNRRAAPLVRGGDRKSVAYRENNKINEALSFELKKL